MGAVLTEKTTDNDQATYREALQMLDARSSRGWGLPVGVRRVFESN